MKRISKKVREEAALICDVSASHPADEQHWYINIQLALGLSADACNLAAEALIAAPTSDNTESGRLWPRCRDAEAALMIRSGWSLP